MYRISCVVTVQPICSFFFEYAKIRFSHDMTQIGCCHLVIPYIERTSLAGSIFLSKFPIGGVIVRTLLLVKYLPRTMCISINHLKCQLFHMYILHQKRQIKHRNSIYNKALFFLILGLRIFFFKILRSEEGKN